MNSERNGRGDDHDAVVVPIRAKSTRRSSTRREWVVDEVRTEPMTDEQYDRVVTNLAVLVDDWWERQHRAASDSAADTETDAAATMEDAETGKTTRHTDAHGDKAA
ncbi:MAG: hypothetical protein ACRDO7_08240 [Nocardioidaceae bacterium]